VMRVRHFVLARVDRLCFSLQFQFYPSLVSRASGKAGSIKLLFHRVQFSERIFRCEEDHAVMHCRHCERSEAIHLAAQRKNGLLRRIRSSQ
jgi:hypothetical protein